MEDRKEDEIGRREHRTMDNKRLKELVEERKEELLDLCCRMIQIPSVNPPGEVEEIVRFICDYLEKHGISWEIIRPTPDTPNIVAKMGNPEGRVLVLNGHCDVVPPGNPDKWDFDPFCG